MTGQPYSASNDMDLVPTLQVMCPLWSVGGILQLMSTFCTVNFEFILLFIPNLPNPLLTEDQMTGADQLCEIYDEAADFIVATGLDVLSPDFQSDYAALLAGNPNVPDVPNTVAAILQMCGALPLLPQGGTMTIAEFAETNNIAEQPDGHYITPYIRTTLDGLQAMNILYDITGSQWDFSRRR